MVSRDRQSQVRRRPESGPRLFTERLQRRKRIRRTVENDALVCAYQQKIAELQRIHDDLHSQLRNLRSEVVNARESGSLFFDFFQSLPFPYFVHDSIGSVLASNKAARQLAGVGGSPRPVRSMMQLVEGKYADLWMEHLGQCGSEQPLARTELRLTRRDGTRFPAEVTTVARLLYPGAKSARYYTVIRDVTSRHAARAALARSQRHYEALIETVEGIVWEADAETLRVRFVSHYAERLLGYPQAEWIRPGFWEQRLHADDRDRVLKALSQAVAQRESIRLDYRMLSASGDVLWLHDSIKVVERDNTLVLLGVAIDVTERNKAEQALREVNELLEQRVADRTSELRRSISELEAFSYTISHDLRSPIRAMMGFATLASQRSAEELSPQLKNFLERIISGAARADRLISDVLDYSRLARQSVRLQRIDVERLVTEIVAQSPEFQSPQAEVQVVTPMLPVLGDVPSLNQCITNLLANAAKFVPPGKTAKIEVDTEAAGDKVRIYVRDKGIGIDPENLERIFGIFERANSSRQYEGTGIGLAIVRRGAERQGGTVGVESTPGAGSCFWIELNAAKSDE